MNYGLMCIALAAGGRLCKCESHPNITGEPFMNKHGDAACQCHKEQAQLYGVEPFPCKGVQP